MDISYYTESVSLIINTIFKVLSNYKWVWGNTLVYENSV